MRRIGTCFRFVASACLLAAGAAKLYAAWIGTATIFAHEDPILGVPNRSLFYVVGGAEIVVAVGTLTARRAAHALLLIAVFSSSLVLYRIGLWWLDYNQPCSCLGTITEALGIAPRDADNMLKLLLAFLALGSYSLLALEMREIRTNSRRLVVDIGEHEKV